MSSVPVLASPVLPPLSLYIHIPWCVQKCPYCDFNSHGLDRLAGQAMPEQAYVQALLADLDQDLHWVQDRPLQSIFFGGGTPSLFSPEAIAEILRGVEARIPFVEQIEITLEANPGTVEQARFEGYRQAGVNRLSIGVQSFDPAQLKRLGRIHNNQDAIRAAESARQAGFNRFNLDLMHGLPEQTEAQALADLQQAIDLQPDHLSWYQLTLEPNTPFYQAPPPLPDDDALWQIQQAGQALIARAGYQQYEVSAYALNGSQARHNLNYWQFGDYLGIGAGAHGKLTAISESGALEIIRTTKHRHPKQYLPAVQYRNALTQVEPDELALEFFMNVLRLRQGVPEALYKQRTGQDLDQVAPILTRLQQLGLLQTGTGQLCTTEEGFIYLNAVLEAFLEA
ncbi:oxygen-independent coproporphyrinogen-3 oxidase [Oceanospirillum multiglobuliferum]|uniref:Heme chaperone HemW n=1 Tax=Oceanospirillum multiglobuliferum TaxID=64969 RepID=A0A1T4SFA6_9GAMM|nr:radical SAM family heme chaperone HemW [Oceanospirillum multiglobuliferum]OPX54300.1 YggW family oxidoreductase [Oceanospirillum multiglobuliferum]SKA26865.1 oxygen-independent coproporphyrinogen-3 oxidase [Oceanospirillum multiglobuliferum]